MFFIIEKSEKNYLSIFTKFCNHHIIIETQKILNLLNSSENEYLKFATKNRDVIESESTSVYSHKNPIKFLTSSLESSLCDHSDAYILNTGNSAVVGDDTNTKVAFKKLCAIQKMQNRNKWDFYW